MTVSSESQGNTRSLSAYVHVPYCASRCGYCDFNTYTADELGPGASRADYVDTLLVEIEQARAAVGARELTTVFFGGGTPTLLPATDLVRVLEVLRGTFGLAADAEVTTEANPDSVDRGYLDTLREGGFTRMSFGWQATAPHVLATLERTHDVGRARQVVADARAAGFEHINVDLIYATPGETDDDLRSAVKAAIDSGVDHISAYSLIVEDGTRLGAQVARGVIPAPSDDVAADRYLLINELLADAGFEWYEVSNWARPGGECRHNLAYWRDADWWGFGPGAHSHVGATRWWNVKHPKTYADRLRAGDSPEQAREHLTLADREVERVMLGVRLREGLRVEGPEVSSMIAEGLLEACDNGVRLTLEGRLLADLVVRRLT